MSSFSRRSALLFLATVTLGGCGFKPLYAGSAKDLIGRIELGEVSGRSDYYLRTALRQRLGDGGADSIYRLDVKTRIKRDSLVLRGDDATTRYNYRATAFVTVTSIKTSKVVLTDELKVSASYDATSSLYSSRTSERAAQRQVSETLGERIASRVIAGLSDAGAV